MSTSGVKTSTVMQYNTSKKSGFVRGGTEGGDPLILDLESAKGYDLKNGVKIHFEIEEREGEFFAINVKPIKA
ncbi:hypothetical protein [Pseudomonas shirazensis]|uniref:hypothetical protein n=1 Tax=Pseudomonas shirazensis TaxID=2745494 RepID=UPI003D2A54F9